MADNSGFPHCTPWKNYRYPMTRLTKDKHYRKIDASGQFGHLSGTRELDIWISDDWLFHGDALGITYDVVMLHDFGGGGNDGIKSLQFPRIFHDGESGTKTLTPGSPHLGLLGSSDNNTYIDVTGSIAETISSQGNPQSLYTIIPGLHFGFMSTSSSIYAEDDNFSWVMDSNILNDIPKVMDGTYTCWYKSPTTGGDTVATEPFPSGIGNKSINISINSKHLSSTLTEDLG